MALKRSNTFRRSSTGNIETINEFAPPLPKPAAKKTVSASNPDEIIYKSVNVVYDRKQKIYKQWQPAEVDAIAEADGWRFDPDSRLYLIWQLVIVFITVYNLIVVPYRCAFGFVSEDIGMSFLFDIFGDILFWIDMWFHFRTPFRKKGMLMVDLESLRNKYIHETKWFWVDLLANLPCDFIQIFYGRLIAWSRVNKVFRIARIIFVINKIETLRNVDTQMVKGLKLMFAIFYLSHWYGCLYWMFPVTEGFGVYDWLPDEEVEDISRMSQYLFALWWAFGMMAGREAGAIPDTTEQAFFSFVVMFSGLLLLTYVTGSISSLVENANDHFKSFQDKKNYIQRFLESHTLPEELTEKVVQYYEYLWSRSKGFNLATILDELPDKLTIDIKMFLCEGCVTSVPLFLNLEYGFIPAVVGKLVAAVYLPAEYVVRAGSTGNAMFFIHKGKCEVIVGADNNAKVVAVLEEGGFFGEFSLLFNAKRNASIRAVGYCDMFALYAADFKSVMEGFETSSRILEERCRDHRRKQERANKKRNRKSSRKSKITQRQSIKRTATISNKHRRSRKRSQFHGVPDEEDDEEDEKLSPAELKKREDRLQREEKAAALKAEIEAKEKEKEFLEWEDSQMPFAVNDPRLKWHQRAVVGFSLYGMLWVPYRMAFAEDEAVALFIFLDIIQDITLIIDIILNFYRSILKDGVVLADKAAIRAMYKNSWQFPFDIICVVPFELLFYPILGYHASFRILRILRVRVIYALMNRAIKQRSNSFDKLGRLLFTLGITTHFIACAWFSFTYFEEYGENAWLPESKVEFETPVYRYTRAMYFALTVLTGMGLTITPFSDLEYVYMLSATLVGVVVVAYLIGNMTTIVSNLDTFAVKHEKQIHSMDRFMKENKLNEELQQRVHMFLQHCWQQQKGAEPNLALHMIPATLRLQIKLEICQDAVMNTEIFNGVEDECIYEIIAALQFEMYPPSEYIFGIDMVGDKMYLISEGVVNIVTGRKESEYRTIANLQKGQLFGEMAVIRKKRRNASALAGTSVDIFSLHGEDFFSISAKYTDLQNRVIQLVRHRAHNDARRRWRRARIAVQQLYHWNRTASNVEKKRTSSPPPSNPSSPNVSGSSRRKARLAKEKAEKKKEKASQQIKTVSDKNNDKDNDNDDDNDNDNGKGSGTATASSEKYSSKREEDTSKRDQEQPETEQSKSSDEPKSAVEMSLLDSTSSSSSSPSSSTPVSSSSSSSSSSSLSALVKVENGPPKLPETKKRPPLPPSLPGSTTSSSSSSNSSRNWGAFLVADKPKSSSSSSSSISQLPPKPPGSPPLSSRPSSPPNYDTALSNIIDRYDFDSDFESDFSSSDDGMDSKRSSVDDIRSSLRNPRRGSDNSRSSIQYTRRTDFNNPAMRFPKRSRLGTEEFSIMLGNLG